MGNTSVPGSTSSSYNKIMGVKQHVTLQSIFYDTFTRQVHKITLNPSCDRSFNHIYTELRNTDLVKNNLSHCLLKAWITTYRKLISNTSTMCFYFLPSDLKITLKIGKKTLLPQSDRKLTYKFMEEKDPEVWALITEEHTVCWEYLTAVANVFTLWAPSSFCYTFPPNCPVSWSPWRPFLISGTVMC